MEGFTQANLFELSNRDIHVTYSTTSILGGPIFSYRDNQLNRSFRGEEIRIQDTDIGQVVTVTLEAIPDFRKVTFSLILPVVTVMTQSVGTHIKVPGRSNSGRRVNNPIVYPPRAGIDRKRQSTRIPESCRWASTGDVNAWFGRTTAPPLW